MSWLSFVPDIVIRSAAARKLADYVARHPAPKGHPGLPELERTASQMASKLPEVTRALERMLPDSLPPAEQLSPDTRSVATRLAERLLTLLPVSLAGALSGRAADATDLYEKARQRYAMARDALPAVSGLRREVAAALVSAAAARGIAAEELELLSQRLDKIIAMAPLVARAGVDLEGRIRALEAQLAAVA